MKIKNQVTRVFCIISFLILLTGFCGVAQAADQKTLEDTERLIKQQQEQLKAQEKALEDLKARVEALAKEEATAKETAAETEKSAQETGKEVRIAKAEDDTPVRMAKEVDVSKEEDRAGDAKGHSFGVPKTDTVITISGYVKADVIHDFDKIASPYKFVTKDIVVNGVPSGQPSSRTTFTANTSRLIFGSATPTDIGKLSTFISFDFANNTTSSDPEFRLRQAWGQLDDFFLGGGLRVGQSWTSWDDVPALPETMDFYGPNGSQQTRQALVRWEREFQDQYTLWVAVEDPDYSIENGDNKSRWPDTIVSLNWHGDWGHLKPAFIGRDIRGDKASSGKTDNAFGWGAQLAGIVNVPMLAEKDNFSFQVVYGGGIGSYNNDGGIDDAVFEGNDLKTIKSFQGYGAFQHWWLDSLRSNAVFGWVDVDTRSRQRGTTLKRTLYVAANLVWSPLKQMDIGGEYLWGQRKNKNNDNGEANRIQVSFKYKF